jgi:gliding motility-associated-like protein
MKMKTELIKPYPMATRLYKYCLFSAILLLISLAGLKAQTVIFTPTNVTCFGAADATMKIDITGGSSTYWYVCYNITVPSLSDSIGPTAQPSYTFTNLNPAQLYLFYVRDNVTGDYVDAISRVFTQPAVLNATVTSVNATCYGTATGSITISSPSGGSGAYDFSINGGSTWQASGSFPGLSAATYIVRIRDRAAQGCIITLNGNLIITQPAELNANLSFTNATCFGKNNGNITISSPSGGSGAYQYTITGAAPWNGSGTFNNLAPGTYNVIMRDGGATSCTRTLNGSLTISQPTQLNVPDISIIKGLTCNEGSDGQLQAIVTGGTSPYSFDWYKNQSGSWVTISQFTQTATNLPQGWYEVRVNDANNCGNPIPATSREFFLLGVTDSVPPVFIFDSASVVSTCAGQSNGSINSHVHGGKKPYRFSITNGGASGYQADSLFINLGAGIYQTWAMDRKGCKKPGPSKTVVTTPNLPVSVSIVANPSGSICPGTSVLFTATPVNGGTTPAYQWRLNGSPVGTNSTTYTNNALANGATVNVILTSNLRCNSGNPATSNTYTASLLSPPSITAQPASLTRCTGLSATFTVTATGTGLAYQWRKGGVNIPGATGSSYTIAVVAITDAASYDVVITGTCGNVTSNAATLTVNTSPAITVQPASTSACVGQGAAFTVTATGTGLAYQWRKGGVNIPGATGSSYTIAVVAVADAGSYDVVITGTCATVTSNAATLTVNTPPVITAQPASLTRCTGLSATFTVTATGTGLAYQWRKGGVNIPGATGSSYTIAVVAVTDAASYDVVITGTCATVTSNTATLTVNTSPVITAQPANTTACVGISASFTVTATGTGLAYQWRKGGVNIPGATGSTYNIGSVAVTDAGSYDVVITGTCATVTSNAATLTVNTPPVITAQPAGLTRCTGLSATFTVTATGTGLAYQWRKGGVNIPGATGSSYTIAVVAVTDAASYDVVITGTCGNVTSNAATLTVNTSPAITVQPASTSACVGQGAAFTVTATGTGLAYQWRKGGVNIPGATGSSYTIAVVAVADAGSYDVVITGTCATVTSNAATLTVNTPPVITAQPASLTRCTGLSATFTVTATGTGLAYQWRKGGVNIPGATGSSYTIAVVAVTDAASYDVVITGTCATVTSNTATLTVNTSPVITAQPANTTACVGISASFTVTATGTGLAYQWRKGGVNIPGATGSTYNIGSVAVTDAGSYDVVITGTCATVTSNAATLTVNTPPVITAQPANTSACVGQGATFTVTATGTGLAYQWRKGGVNIPGATGLSYTIAGVAITDAGSFDVVITGTCATVTSNAATLTINTPPVITAQPVSLTRCTGLSATFDVTATGTGLAYQWRKGGANIPGATGSSYTIAVVAVTDAGSYDVVITGTCATVTSNAATLTVNLPPSITTQPVSVTSCEGTTVNFSVTAGGAGLTYQWRKNGANIPGATASVLTLNNINLSSAAGYDVFITGTCGNITSNTATLIVAEKPIITLNPTDQEVCEGSSLTLNASATGTGISYQWRRNGVDLTGQTAASLTLNAVIPAQSGNYDVLAYNQCDTVTSNIAVVIIDPATAVLSSGNDTLVCIGGTVDFKITANGHGAITYQWQWQYAGSWIDLSDGGDITGSATAHLNIQNVEAGDTGYYRCFISSACGTAYSNPVLLAVNNIVATIGTPAPFLIDSTTTLINVSVRVTDRFLNWDLGFALVAPDGTEVLLKGPLAFPCVLNPFGNGVNATFTNDPAVNDNDTIDYCLNTKLISGTFAATGNWNVLHGMDPANGAWQIRVYDSDKSVPDPDGYLRLAALTFTDLDFKGDTAVVTYNSGIIQEEILNPISGELRGTSFVVPIRLMTSCFNAQDARAVVTVQGGIAPFTYQWTGPTVVPAVDDVMLGPGNYSVLVTDALGCSSTATVEVSSPPAIVFDSEIHTDTIACFGATEGIIRSKASGGSGTLTYILIPGNIPSAVSDSGVFSNLAAGTYTIRVTDINGCSLDSVIQIFQHTELTVQIDLVPVIGANPGSITLTASGGVPPYQYSIDNGTTLQDSGEFINLPAGIYPVYVVDASGCIFTQDVNLNIQLLNVDVTIHDVSCYGLADGSFFLALTDGVGPYTLTGSFLPLPQVLNSGAFSFTGQTAGLYDVRIEDSEGRLFIDTIAIKEPTQIIATAIITNATCSAITKDGAIDLTVTGGSGIFTFNWSNGATSEDLVNIEAGSYSVIISDTNGCSSETFAYDVFGTNVATAYAGENDTICPGTEYQLVGSTAADSVRWDPAVFLDNNKIYNPMADISAKTTFFYTVYNHGCYDIDTLVIDVFERIGMDIYDPSGIHESIGDSLYLLEGESATMAATPGFVSYSWIPTIYLSDPTLEAVLVTPAANTYYTVFGTTDKGCVETDRVKVVIARRINIYSGFSPNGDAFNNTWVIDHAEEYGDRIRVRVFNRWGEPVFESKGYGGSGNEWDGNRNGKPLPVGTYYYIIDVKDGKSAPYTGTVTILR